MTYKSTKEWINQEMKDMYEELTDPTKREEVKRKNDRELRIQEKKSDTGL